MRLSPNVKTHTTQPPGFLQMGNGLGKVRENCQIWREIGPPPFGTRAFWPLVKAVHGNFCQPSIPPLHRKDDTTLDDRGRSPPNISRCLSSMPEIIFWQRAVRKALSSSSRASLMVSRETDVKFTNYRSLPGNPNER
ncbi:unnamed protein product [Pieris macdunnoughi]|uniref:Uncharacterized protein n=1 Tax=Pieris macdunnoughi TaxID=345717 RepID=A0A821LXH2_9NEOP|nr:unnamed protein product [Pieris macdunnoughi]